MVVILNEVKNLIIFCHYDERSRKNQEENEDGKSNVKAKILKKLVSFKR